MPQPPATSRYGLITDSPDDFRLSQERIDQQRLATERSNQQKAAEKRRQEALDQHLSRYDDDPISRAVATMEFEKTEADENRKAQIAARQKEHDKISAKYDDPIAQAWAIMQYDDEQTKNLPAKQAFADREALQKLNEREDTTRKLDSVGKTLGLGIGDAFVRETVGSAVNVVPDLAAVPARAMEAVGLAEPGTADELHRGSEAFQQGRQEARRDDMSPWLSRMYGGASQSALQMAATPGGAASKIVAAGVMSGDAALTTGKDAGLEGIDLARYAGTQGLLEAGVAAIGQKIFGPGIESRMAGQAVAAETMKQLAKNIGTDALKEMPEEVVTSILQDISSKYEGVSPDMNLNDFVSNSVDAAVQSALMAGMANAPNAATLVPPAIKAFTSGPSRKNYEAAVAAGLPPLAKSTTETRSKYAKDLLKDPFGMRKPELGDPSPPTAATPDPATLEPAVQIESPPATVADGVNVPVNQFEEIQNGQEVNNQVEAQGNQVAGANGTQGQEGRQELLTESPAGTQVLAPPAAVNDSPTPAAHTNREDFEREYRDTYAKMMEYTPDQAGSQYYSDKMADLWDSNPEWAQEIEQTKTSPGVAPGDVSPDQPSSPMADPVSSNEPPSGQSQPESTQAEVPRPSTKEEHSQLPVFSVYQTQFNGKPKFAVKQNDKGGFGDALFDTESDANQYASVVKQQSDDAMARREKAQADEEAATKKQQEHEVSFHGFLTDDPKTKGRRLKTLDSALNYKNKPTTRKALVEQKVSDGWTVNDQDQLQAPTGEFLDSRDLTKTGIEYARHLVNKSSDSEKAVPWRRTVDEERPAYNRRLKTEGWTPLPKPDISVIDSPGVIKQQSLEQQKKSPYKKGDRVTVTTGYSTDEMQIGGEVLEDSLPESPQIKVRVDSGKVHYVMAYYTAPVEKAAKAIPKQEPIQTVAGKMTYDEFESKGYSPEQVTQKDWVNLQKSLRRSLGQSESSGTKAAPFADYEEFHRDAVRKAVEAGNDVDFEVLSDYPDLASATEHDRLYKELQPLYRDPKHKAGDREHMERIRDLEQQVEFHKPAAVARAQAEIDAEAKKKPQETKPKAEPTTQSQSEPSQEDLMEAILREELGQPEAKPAKERKPRTPKTGTAEPKAPKTPRSDAAKKRTERTAAELKAAEDDVFKAFNATPNTGLNPEQMRATARLVKAALNHNVSTFNQFVAYVIDKFGEPMALKMAEGIELAWRSLKRLDEYSGIDDAGKVSDIVGTVKATPKTGWAAIPGHFAEQLLKGEQYTSISEARREAGEIIGQPVKPGTAEAKQLDEAIEYGIVQAGRKIVSEGGTQAEIYDKLVDLYERQPTLGVRDSNSMEMQAYSTPVPLAWLVSTLGNVTPKTKVYEPTAGNGMLLIGTDVKNAFANELDPARAQTLRDQGFNVTQADASTATSPKVQTVLANPPFGKVKDANRKTVEFDVDGFKTTEVDHAIALQSLKGMEAGGHTVLILAAKGHNVKGDLERRMAYSKGKDRPFYDALYQGYDVTSHFTVDGSLYSRQGASFPVDVIVLRPLGTVPVDQKRATPWAMVPRIFSTWQEIRNANFNENSVADSSDGSGVLSGNGDNGSTDLSTGNADDVGRIPGQNENATSMAEGDVDASESEPVVSTPVDGKTGSRRGGKKSGGSRSQSGLSTTIANERGGEGNVSNAGEVGSVSKGLDSGDRPDGLAGTGTSKPELDPESHQSAYEPSSKNRTVDTLVPTNLQDAIRTALDNVEDAHGPIDAFVRTELGYGPNDRFFNDLSAEQVDALALAIHSHQSGAGMVVGDMTGVGKGRVAAAMMRYAERQGLVPVFVTEKPDLFGDMYRDLADIGSDSADAPFFAQPTSDTAGSKAIDLPDGRKLKSSKETAIARIDEALASLKAGNGFTAMVDGVPTKINAVFTMYSQLQTVKGEETLRRQQLRDLMPHAFLIMDESHNAGGTVKERVNEEAPPDRAALARELVQSSAGTMYLSATFAKRPDVMDLYSKTDMAKAVNGDITKLSGVLQTGGLPLQQVLSAMLGESGQYIRREKSFAGIEFSKVDVGVNLEEQDKITDVFRGIRTLDGVINEIVTGMNDELVAAGEHGVAGDVSTGDAGMTSNSFSSILWNAVDQMLFALKADKAADNAIEAWKNGETPILAVDNTMERIIDEYVEENELKVGDVVNLSFRHILHRYLERSRWITIDTGMRDARGKKINRKERLTDDQLNVETPIGNALTMFNAAYEAIEATDIDAPASPIDWMRHRMQKAGMKIAEITGRNTILVYSDAGVATLGTRPRSERGTRGKQETIRRINDGSLDGLLLNRSGATGVSIHASSKFKNQKVRHMMIVQPAKNIDEFMQMLGRVNRTGQVVKPRYSLMMSDSPAELRPAAVLSKKLASLNASVTAKSKGAVGFDVVDVMNEVGGAIISQYLYDNPEFALSLDMTIEEMNEDSESDSLEDVARKATGRSSILPIQQQREFWDDITAAYNARIEELNAFNANPLIAQTMDLDAKTLSTINVFAGEPDQGPFAAPADIVRMDVKNPGKPMTSAQVTGRIMEFYGINSMDEMHNAAVKWERDTTESLTDEMPDFKAMAVSRLVNPEAVAARISKLDEQKEEVIRAIQDFSPGTVVTYAGEGLFVMKGVVIGVRRTGKTGNPAAPSRWMIEVAVNDSAKKINVPVSQLRGLSGRMESMDSVLSEFETMQTRSREKRWMGTGNLVAAYARLAAQNGKLVFYTDDQGNTRRGIIMPRAFDAAAFLEQQPVQFQRTDDILRYFERGGERLVSADHELVVVNSGNGALNLWAPRARSRGGKYTLNQGIRTAAGRDFISVGNRMNLFVSNSDTKRRIIDAILELTTLEASGNDARILAREILGLSSTGQPISADSQETPGTATQDPSLGSANAPISDAQKAVNDARASVDAQRAENDRQDDIIARELRKRGTAGLMIRPITGELATALAKRTLGAIKLGAKQFDLFIKELRRKYSESEIKLLKSEFISVWNVFKDRYDLDEATSAGFDAALSDTVDLELEQAIEAITPAESQNSEPAIAETSDTAATPEMAATTEQTRNKLGTNSEQTPDPATQPTATGDDKEFSPKNAFTDLERERLGMEKRVPLPEIKRQVHIGMAAAEVATVAGNERIDATILDLKTTGRAPTPYETALVNARYAQLDNKREAALNAKVAARESGDDAQVAIQDAAAEKYLEEMVSVLELEGGTASYMLGAGLQARKDLINRDYSMPKSILEFESAYGRKPDDKEKAKLQKQIDELAASNERLRKLLDEASEDIESLEARLKQAHDGKVRQAREPKERTETKAPKTAAEKTRRDKALEKIHSAGQKFRSLLKLERVNSVEGVILTIADASLEMATGYAELGVISLADFLKRATRTIGPEAKNYIAELTAAWRQVRPIDGTEDTSSITDRIDRDSPDTIGRAARDLHAFVIERDGLDASPEGREAAVAAVHAILVDIVPELTLEETARAMSGIGIYSELSDNEIDVIRRDQKAQLLSLEQIADWKKGQAPPATGQERAPVSDEQRALRKAVNEAKKASGIETTTEGQLRSALDAAKRMLVNRIADLKKAITENERITRSKKVLEDPSGELKKLQDERDFQQQRYNEAFGKNELSDEQRLNLAEKALDRAIANLESDLKSGKLYADPAKPRLTSAAIEAKQAALDALKANRDELRLSTGEAEARSDAAYERRLKERNAELSRRLVDGDFMPAAKKPERKLTPAMLKEMRINHDLMQKIMKERKDQIFRNRHIIYKAAVRGPIAGMHIIRKVLTAFDNSLVGRQGRLLAGSHPIIWAKAVKNSFGSNWLSLSGIFPSEQDLFDIQARFDADDNWVRLEKIAKLAVTDVHGGMAREEENQYVPEWVNKIPGIGGSERAASAFINTQRRLVFRSLVEKLAKRHELQGGGMHTLSASELRMIGNAVNVPSGRADIGHYLNGAEAASVIFFSPRWWASRIMFITGEPLWHEAKWRGGEGVSSDALKVAAAEWGKQLAAQAIFIGFVVGTMKAILGPPGDDEEWDFYWDPKSPYFGQIRYQNTYQDMTSGVGQHISTAWRLYTKKQVNRWEGEVDTDMARVGGRYLQGKMAPIPSIATDYVFGPMNPNVEFGTLEWAYGHVAPLMYQDYEQAQKAGPIAGKALALLAYFGNNSRTQEERVKERVDVSNELRVLQKRGESPEKIQEVLTKHLKHTAGLEAKAKLKISDPDDVPSLEKVAAGEESPELTEAIQKEKHDITLRALEMLSTEDKKKEKKPGEDNGITTARSLLRTMAPTYDEANALFESAYKQRNGSLKELVGEKGHKRWQFKPSVTAARRRMKAIYATK